MTNVGDAFSTTLVYENHLDILSNLALVNNADHSIHKSVQ